MSKYITLALAICILMLIGVTITAKHFFEKYQNEKQQKEATIQLLGNTAKELEVYKNSYNHLVTKNEVQTLDAKTVKKLIDEGALPWVKELESVRKSIKNVEFLYKSQIAISDSLKAKLDFITKNYINEKGDTIPFSAFIWGRKTEYGYDSLLQITPDSVFFKEKEIVPVYGAIFWERKWFLGKKNYFGEITSPNISVQITELLNIKVQKRK